MGVGVSYMDIVAHVCRCLHGKNANQAVAVLTEDEANGTAVLEAAEMEAAAGAEVAGPLEINLAEIGAPPHTLILINSSSK